MKYGNTRNTRIKAILFWLICGASARCNQGSLAKVMALCPSTTAVLLGPTCLRPHTIHRFPAFPRPHERANVF